MRKNGFTLLEVLFSLSIWGLFILLSVPVMFSVIDKQEEKQFFETFEFDLLYMQNMSYTTTDYIRLTFKLNSNTYEIRKGNNDELLVKRSIPDDWIVQKRKMTKPISFNANGTIKQSGSLYIQTKLSEYRIVFPLGKGRCYIEKQ
ncbi:competence type IV pilus minor pilin ComGD [Virgibacillus oceani]|uniref:Competence protein ComG n=1 Tax=Virgibacillus oceani TaxID=1479511 RepID=A0A917H0S5_9BACI|nr:competence type IV pilus minor pilin ComGD [Virgibacillus oceani]GGG63763.1 competence protein ComG [Virgibacillus oceani]